MIRLQNFRMVGARVENDGKYGFIDTLGQEIIPPIYMEIKDFNQGVAWAYKDWGSKYNLIDTLGKGIIPPLYREVTDFVQGRAWVTESEWWAYSLINSKGKKIIPPGKVFPNHLRECYRFFTWDSMGQRIS